MSYNRVYNFSAGPSMLPESVLEKAAAQMMNYEGSGMSVMEMSHRSKVYESIIGSVESKLRKVMNIPDNYKVLFLQGGATGQFAAIPMNLMTKNKKADYIVTGQFSKKAADEAKKYGEVHIAASSKDKNFTYIPRQEELDLSPDADYVYICYNNTIYGSTWDYIPETNGIPLVADISSFILSAPLDISKFGLVYAGAQKNMGPAGVTVVIVREDLMDNAVPYCPVVWDYKTMSENDSMYNTPPTYGIYMIGLVLDWVEENGGCEGLAKINEAKAKLLYEAIDQSPLFSNPVDEKSRSMMNVTFVTGDEAKDADFVKKATAEGFLNIKGHRSVGGMRASIYNAMPTEGIEKLVEFMKNYEKE
ncbi:MAG: 3-phosphoserine/phosphohydroxythreonine transaminase [Clostridia bacterium]|nr:3-phosphoserine/phosphohydroxythreonine transaminase [Clostridia bacterium]